MQVELKACAHCGGAAHVETNEAAIEELGIVQAGCTKCGALGPFVDADVPDAQGLAALAWNTRFEASLPPSAPVDRPLVDDLTGALRFILAFYEPGQRYLDSEAWKCAEAGGRAALARGEAALATPSVLAESTSNDCLLVAEGWQDIATLKDEDGYVLGWSPRSDGFSVREYFMGCRYDIRTDALINEWTGRWCAVTHWRPLPAPPAVNDLSGVGVG